jgi:hypothetical protein
MASLNSRKHGESLSSVRAESVPQVRLRPLDANLDGRLSAFKYSSRSQIWRCPILPRFVRKNGRRKCKARTLEAQSVRL